MGKRRSFCVTEPTVNQDNFRGKSPTPAIIEFREITHFSVEARAPHLHSDRFPCVSRTLLSLATLRRGNKERQKNF